MTDETGLGALLPVLGARETWAVGLAVVLAVLRPVGRAGWAVAAALVAGALGVMTVAGVADVDPALWQLLPWVALAGVLVATAAGSPLRWEPRTGPSAGSALVFGAILLHVGVAWHTRDGALVMAADRWASGDLTAAELGPEGASPLTLPFAWVLSRIPGIEAGSAVAALGLVAAAAIVLAAGHLALGWGYTGTSRATMAAVAWAPPLLLAHVGSQGVLMAGAALMWSWWALGEIWSGRHLGPRMALLSGGLLGAAAGLALWPLLVLPLWIRRLSGRKLAWFAVGLLAATVLTLAVLLPTDIGIGGVWQVGVLDPVSDAGLGSVLPLVLVAFALAGATPRAPLSPTRLSAATAALFVLATPWWPSAWHTTGPIVAIPFVLLAAVAPDRPDEHWPPDAPLPVEDYAEPVGG